MTDTSIPTNPVTPRAIRRRGSRMSATSRIASILLAVIALACVIGPLILHRDPLEQDLSNVFASPSWKHLLGTDDSGRDVLTRLLVGGRVTLLSSLMATVVAVIGGSIIGLLAGFIGGWFDSLIGRLLDAVMALPAILLAVVAASVLDAGVYGAMLSVGVIFAPLAARLVRAEVLRNRESLYVEALRSLGATGTRIAVRHMSRNCAQPVLVQSTLIFAYALIAEASLSFLGFGVVPPAPSWGGMLGRAYATINQHPAQILVPGLAITVTVLCVNSVGEQLRQGMLKNQ